MIFTCWASLVAPCALIGQGTPRPGAPAATQQAEIDRIAREAQDGFGKGDWENAIRGYENLVKLAPNVAEYHLNLGIALHSAGRPLDAVQPLRQAAEAETRSDAGAIPAGCCPR